MECIHWLLMENSQDSLTMTYADGKESQLLDLSGGLLSNKSLKKLVLHDENPITSSETIHAVSRMLQEANPINEIFSLLLTYIMEDQSETVQPPAQAAEGHCTLKKLKLSDIQLGDEEAGYLAAMLAKLNPTLQRLKLRYNEIRDVNGCVLGQIKPNSTET
jgi:hypothetical protein